MFYFILCYKHYDIKFPIIIFRFPIFIFFITYFVLNGLLAEAGDCPSWFTATNTIV